jgi:hypothetical protein
MNNLSKESINVTEQIMLQSRITKKWWQHVTYFILNVSRINNFILFDLLRNVYLKRQIVAQRKSSDITAEFSSYKLQVNIFHGELLP